MTNNALSSYLKHCAGQLRKAPRLNVIDSLKPLSQRQALIEIHDLIFSPLKVMSTFSGYKTIDAF
jgi:hypothetical protein